MKQPLIPIPSYPFQIVEEVSSDLEMVYVIPVRNRTDQGSMEQFLMQLVSVNHPVEAILVIHSFEFDGDAVRKANLEFYWEMERRKPYLAEKGIAVQLVNYIGIDQVYESTWLPFFMGMKEALQRLKDAGNMNGVIACLEGAEQLSSNFTESILAHYWQHPRQVAAACALWYDLDGGMLGPEAFRALIHHELRSRLHQFLLWKCGYGHTWATMPYLFSVRAWMLQQLHLETLSVEVGIAHLLHLAGNQGGKTGVIGKARIIPDIEQAPHGDRLARWMADLGQEPNDAVYGMACYEQLNALLRAVPRYYEATTLDGFQAVIRELPQPVVAYLSDVSFFEKWEQLKARAANFGQFRRGFYDWFTPSRITAFLEFTASHFYQYGPLQNVAAGALFKHFGLRSKVMDAEQMLYAFRRQAGGMEVVGKAGRA